MKRIKWQASCLLVFLALALNAYAQTAPTLGTAGNFAVLGGSAVTSAVATTTITGGNVGVYPGTSITGLFNVTNVLSPYVLVPNSGVTNPPILLAAQNALGTAFTFAAGETPTSVIDYTSVDLGGLTLGPGVYKASTTAQLTGTLTLSGGPTDVWIFQVGTGLTTGSGAKVAFIGGASPCNVYWQIGTLATIGVGTNFAGVIMAGSGITLVGGTLDGRALALTPGPVTITGSETIVNGCTGTTPPPPTTTIVASPVYSTIVCGTPNTSITKTAVVLSNGVPVPNVSVNFKVTAGPMSDVGKNITTTTDATGTATVMFTNLTDITATQGDTIVAYTTVNNTALTSNLTFATCSGSITGRGCRNLAAPTVSVVTQTSGPPKQVIFSVRAPGGLYSLVANTPPTTNATVVISPFDSGTILAVGVIATKINQSKSSVVELTVTDLCGKTTVFDPVFATITIPAADFDSDSKSSHAERFDFDHQEVDRFDGIGHTEGIVLLLNGTPGVESLVITVNGSKFRTQLADGETKKLDISSALFHRANSVKVTVVGDPGSSVDLTISDGK